MSKKAPLDSVWNLVYGLLPQSSSYIPKFHSMVVEFTVEQHLAFCPTVRTFQTDLTIWLENAPNSREQ